MQEMDFYELSRAVQDRFTVSIRGEGHPRPLLAAKPGPSHEVVVWSAIGCGAFVLVALLVGFGIGDLGSSFAIHPMPLAAGYAVLLATIAVAVMQVLSRLRQTWSLPYRPGIYLFPAGVVDARSHALQIFPLSRLVTPTVGDKTLTLAFPEGATFTFPLAVSGHSDEVKKTIEEAQAAVEKAHAGGDKKSLGLLDPLVDIGVVNPFAPTARLEKNTPFWSRQVWIVGAVIGLILAPGAWYLRNFVSDGRMLADANRRKDAASFRAYLERGGKKGEVREVLLPRAELSEAMKVGTVEAIEKYMAAHESSRIQNEVSAALRQSMLAELDAVKKVGTVSAVAEFSKRHSNNLVDAEIKQAMHGVYQAALAKYKRESGVRDQNVIGFVERLLAFTEKNGPKAEIRFRRKQTRSMDLADAQIKKSPFFNGVVSVPSQYFDEAHARQREANAAKTIVSRFATAFPPDILSLEVGPPVTEEGLPPGKIPMMFVEHGAEMSGASYLSRNPRGVFVGLGMLFEVTFKIPDDAKPQKYRLSAWRPPDTTVPKGDGSFESAVYEAMAGEGFVQFAQRYLSTFFPRAEAREAKTEAKASE